MTEELKHIGLSGIVHRLNNQLSPNLFSSTWVSPKQEALKYRDSKGNNRICFLVNFDGRDRWQSLELSPSGMRIDEVQSVLKEYKLPRDTQEGLMLSQFAGLEPGFTKLELVANRFLSALGFQPFRRTSPVVPPSHAAIHAD